MKKLIILILAIQITLMSNGQWEIVHNDNECIFHSVYFINDSTGFVVGSCEQIDVVLKTTNYGVTWHEVYSEDVNYFYDIYFPTSTIGYISAYTNVLKTIDGGENWFYPNPEFEGYPYRSIVFQDEEIGFGCFADGGAAFATTTDGGNTWIEDYSYGGRELLKLGDCEIRVISGQYGKSDNCWESYETSYSDIGNRTKSNFAMPNKDTILVCGVGLSDESWQNFGFVAKSVDDGEAWSTQDFVSTYALRSIVSVNDSIYYCVGYPYNPNPHAFLKSTDGGDNWHYQEYETTCDECFAVDVRDVYCPSENVCYAVSGDGLIYRTLNGGGELFPLPTSISEPMQLNQFQLYPNPATNQLTIESKYSIQELHITNTLGQVVLDISTKLNTTQQQLDISNLSQGVYLATVQTKYGLAVQRFVKE